MSTALGRSFDVIASRPRLARERGDIDEIANDVSLIEKFRLIIAALDLPAVAARPLTIGVTATLYDEGATSVALGLAATLAREQPVQVAIADCDLGWPSLHQRLKIPLTPGLGELIVGRATKEDALRPTGQPNLVALPAGKRPQRGADAADRVRHWLKEFKQESEYDVLILDLPPVNVDEGVGVLASVTDAVVLVVQSGVTPRNELRSALARLRGYHLAGIVVNRAQPTLPDWLVRLINAVLATG